MEKKLFVFDLDGTLLTSKNQLLQSTVLALDYLQRKHTVMLATGRSRFLIKDILDELAIKDYIVCNGSAAFLNDRQVFKRTLEKNKLKTLLTHFRKQKIDIALTGLDHFCRISSFQVSQMEQAMRSIGGEIPDYLPDFHLENDTYQGLAFYAPQLDERIQSEFSDFRFVRWHPLFVDIVPNQGSKAVTMLTIAQNLGIKTENIISFGDEKNDIEMLTAAGTGIAMGNANDSVKAIADFVTKTNDDDGIVYALEKFKLL